MPDSRQISRDPEKEVEEYWGSCLRVLGKLQSIKLNEIGVRGGDLQVIKHAVIHHGER